MRMYSFINCYLSSIQQGIQSAHLVGEFHNEADRFKSKKWNIVKEWSSNHKTMIVCNGGNNKMLLDLIAFLDDARNPYPVACFHEDEDSLCGALTGVGIILPENIYDAKFEEYERCEYDTYFPSTRYVYHTDSYDDCRFYEQGSFEYELIKRVKSYRLAN